jgi:MFS transporter, DHA1 family, multidrug resistance protein
MFATVTQSGERWRRNFWLMVAVQAFSNGSFNVALPFIPLLIQQLGVHEPAAVAAWSGIILSINALTGALFAPLWGSMADRIGRKAMVVRSSIFGGIGSILMGLAPTVPLLLAARAAQGVAGGFSSAAAALVGSIVPQSSLGFALGWMSSAQMFGGLIGPLIGGAFCDATHNYATVFYLTTVGTTLCAIVVARFVHEDFTRPVVSRTARPPVWRQISDMVRHPEMTPMFVIIILGQVTVFSVTPVITLDVQQMIGNSGYLATFAGAAFAVMGVGDLIASPFLGKRSDQLGYRRVLLIATAGAALFTIPQGFVHNIWAFMALRFGVGMFLGGVIPTAYAWIGRIFPPEQRGLVYGVSYSASFLGQFLGPALGGLLAARFGISSVFIVTGLLMLANLVWIARVRPAEHHAAV